LNVAQRTFKKVKLKTLQTNLSFSTDVVIMSLLMAREREREKVRER